MTTRNTCRYHDGTFESSPYCRFVTCVRDHLSPDFMKRQQEAAFYLFKNVLSNLDIDAGAEQIRHVISLGCGTGEELLYLAALSALPAHLHNAKHPEARKKPPLLTFLGIDSSRESRRAFQASVRDPRRMLAVETLTDLAGVDKEDSEGNVTHHIADALALYSGNVAFHEWDLNREDYADLEQYLRTAQKIEPAKTLLLCIGHTIAHFHSKEFKAFLTSFAPKFVLCDFHEGWDEAIRDVRDSPKGFHFEPRAWRSRESMRCPANSDDPNSLCSWLPDSDCEDSPMTLFGLGTIPSPEHRGMFQLVKRGIARATCTHEKQNPPMRLLIETEQVMLESVALVEDLSKDSGYLPVSKHEYHGGYGHLVGTLLWKATPAEELIREALYKSFSQSFMPSLLLAGYDVDPQIRFYMGQFDRVLIYGLFGTDKYLCFSASYSFADSFDPAGQVTEKDDLPPPMFCIPPSPVSDIVRRGTPEVVRNSYLLVQPFSLTQNLLPTADGIFFSLLHSPAGSCVVPPSRTKRERMVGADKEFALEEEKQSARNASILRGLPVNDSATEPDTSAQEDHIGQGTDTHSEARVRLWGTKEWLCVPVYVGSFPLFVLFLKPSRAAIRASFSRDYWETFAKELLRAIAGRSIPLLQSRLFRPFCEELLRLSSLSSLPRSSSDTDIFRLAEEAIADSMAKPWKSWITAFPEFELRHLPESEPLNEGVKGALRGAIESVGKSERVKIMNWFSRVRFFSDDPDAPKEALKNAHDYVTHVHFKRLLLAMKYSGVEVDEVSLEAECSETRILSPLKDDLFSALVDSGISENYAKWVVDTVSRMPFVSASETSGKLDLHEDHFIPLKLVFCRNRAGEGMEYRYSTSALVSLIEMEFALPSPGKSDRRNCFSPSGMRPCCTDDRLDFIVQQLKTALDIAGLKPVEVRCDEETGDLDDSISFHFRCTIILDLNEKLTLGKSGNTSDAAHRSLEALGIDYDEVEGGKELPMVYHVFGPKTPSGYAISVDDFCFGRDVKRRSVTRGGGA